MTLCCARQFSDQMLCMRCDQGWDANDPDPPKCKDNPPSLTEVNGQRFMELSTIQSLYSAADAARPGVVRLARMIDETTGYNKMQALDAAKKLYDKRVIEVLIDGKTIAIKNPYYQGGKP